MNNQSVLIFDPKLAAKIGLNEAIIFHQLQYWQKKYGQERWIYNSYWEWQRQFPFLSIATIRRIFQSLVDREIIEYKRSQSRNAYRICVGSDDFVVFKSQHFPAETVVANDQDEHPQVINMSNGDVQDEHLRMINLISRDVQNDHPQMIKMSNCYSNKTTTKNTTKTTTNNSLLKNTNKGKEDEKKDEEEEKYFNEEKNEEIDTVKKLLAIWHEHIPEPQGKRFKFASQARNNLLLYVFIKHFKADIDEWKRFILYITKSKFLMGGVSSFQISLAWAIIEQNLLKILRGCYHSESERRKYRDFKKVTKALQDLYSNDKINSQWKNTLQDIVENIGETVYVSWFADLKFVSMQEGILTLQASSDFKKDYIDQQYGKKLFRIAGNHFAGLQKIHFIARTVSEEKIHKPPS